MFKRKTIEKKEEETPFFSLAPTRKAQDIDAYKMAMDFALRQEDICNIAITGPYGSGKSSFLRTYFDGREDVLWISLASFLGVPKGKVALNGTTSEGGESDEDEGDSCFGEERRLELSILQQIFYRFPNAAVPYSRLSKTSSIPQSWYCKIIAWAVITFALLIGAWQPDFLVRYVTPSIRLLIVDWARYIFWVSSVGLTVSFSLAIWQVLHWIRSHGVRSVDVSGLGISMSDKTERSILNRNIDEIIYHFEVSDYNTVVFEDIDRFDDVDIFTKLREVNLLLNNAEQISRSHKPIRFIYALKEELFVEKKDKVKFFDFVIPIIPKINASNSRTELLAFLNDWSDTKPDETLIRFVKVVSPYISDMRLLKNICNEYYTYREQVIDYTSEQELLGLVVFKNFFPKDFALMHDESGMMWKFLEKKKEAQEKLAKDIDDKINALRHEIDCINGEKLTDIKQLQLLYYATLMQEFDPDIAYVHIHGEQRFTSAILHYDNWFDVLRTNGFSGGRYGNRPIKWADVEKKTDPNCTYEEHVKRIESRLNGRIEKIKQEIQGLKERRLTIKRKTIQELMVESVLKDDEIKAIIHESSKDRQDAELVILLLKNGYLNEKYYYNISIFHEVDGVNSIQDYLFEVGVTRGDDADWKTKLKNPRALIESLELHYFSSPSMLNYDICRELLANPGSEKAKEFWQLISRKDLRSYEFVDGYLAEEARGDDSIKLFDCIMSANQNYMAELIETSVSGDGWPRQFVEKQLGLYVAWAMRQGKAVAPSNIVKKYVEQTAAMPQLLRDNGIGDAETMTAFVRRFDLKFEVLDFKLAQETSFIDVVISECAYVIDAGMLKGLLSAKGVDVNDFETKNYSVIRSCGIKPIVEYVDKEFKIYLDNVQSRLESQQEDSIENIALVLNHDDLSEEDITRFVAKQSQQGRIDDAKKLLSDRALALCIRLKWLTPTWHNAAEVWNRIDDGKSLFWEYVNDVDCYSALSRKNSRSIAWEEDEKWARRFAEEKQLSDEAMDGLLSGMSKGVISKYSGANATPKRIELLAKGNRIRYSNELYHSLRDIGNDSHIVYAAMFVKEFCNEYSDSMANRDDVKKLFESGRISRRNMPMAVNTVKEIVLANEDLIADVALYVNVGNYMQFDESILDAIIEKLSLVSLQCKIIQYLGGSADETRNRLRRMAEPYNKLGEFGCHPQISKWDGVEDFIEFLKGKGIVSSMSEKPDGKIQVNTTHS